MPGLKVVLPSTPADVIGLLAAADNLEDCVLPSVERIVDRVRATLG